MPRKPLLAGNWKMYKTPSETAAFFNQFKPLVAASTHCDIVICPPFVDIPAAVEAAQGSHIAIGAQNLHWAREGAYTGEVSGAMIRSAGAQWVIIGHSERRQYFGETNETVNRKILAALDAGLRPIVCMGESAGERESGATESVLREQFLGGVAPLTGDQFERIVIAYEPVWAIGTGKTATPEIAADAHRYIRGQVADKYGFPAADALRILYGGSVKPDNIKALMAQPEIDGALVGGASLDPSGFSAIVNF
jgi:triosephosphate isomerase